MLVLTFLCAGCGTGTKDAASDYEAYARTLYDAIETRDKDALFDYCAHPEDHDLNGSPLMYPSDLNIHGIRWDTQLRESIGIFYRKIEEAGGLEAMRWKSFGKAIGVLPEDSHFVGNMYILVSLNGNDMAIEIASSQETQERGRVILGVTPFSLKTMKYYETNARDPEIML